MRGGPRGMDGAAVIVVNSPSVYVSANSLRKETGDILHTVLQTRNGSPQLKRVNLKP